MSVVYSAPAVSVRLKINGLPAARADRYAVRAEQKLLPAESYGSAVPLALLPLGKRFTVELSRLKWESEPLDFYTLSNFTVKITALGKTTRFSGCEWSRLEEKSEHALLWEKAVFSALSREEVTAV